VEVKKGGERRRGKKRTERNGKEDKNEQREVGEGTIG
jgi:hypothetical protein